MSRPEHELQILSGGLEKALLSIISQIRINSAFCGPYPCAGHRRWADINIVVIIVEVNI
jgi:hypothetical protein